MQTYILTSMLHLVLASVSNMLKQLGKQMQEKHLQGFSRAIWCSRT